ncbi:MULTISPECIES: TetR/AcrR family transcriptional regulator [unclassified Ruegeria]|uniref:TetR/AcrR family transcriptional regulator n=1 Tax=unclassified Ruegeria TaxID=2625375 RepID=UPI0014887F7C|nr:MULTISPECIES: TetR/AcrR family transcriptional regulator [unclassified Ruegeria]
MAGLRERQKAARERRILEAASAKFRSHGYRSVKIEDLAEMAEVSVGTVYNYYETKGDILIATVAMEVEEVIAAGAPILANPPQRVDDALLALIYQYYDHSLEYLSKEMWRAAIAHSIEHPNTPSGRRYAEQDRRLAAQVTELIRVLQGRKLVRQNLIATDLGTLIFGALNQAFIEFVKQDDITLVQLRTQIAAQIAPVASLMSGDAPVTNQ